MFESDQKNQKLKSYEQAAEKRKSVKNQKNSSYNVLIVKNISPLTRHLMYVPIAIATLTTLQLYTKNTWSSI